MTRSKHISDWALAKSLNYALDFGIPSIYFNKIVIVANKYLDGDILAGLLWAMDNDNSNISVSIPKAKKAAEAFRNRPNSN